MTSTPPPSPAGATDAATFMAELRRLKTRSGLSFRQLDRRAAAGGDTLPYSTASTMLGKDRLPREELLIAFVKACGLDGDDLQVWRASYAQIAHGPAAASSTPAQEPPFTESGAQPPPRFLRLFRRRVIITVAALSLALMGGAGFALGLEGISETEVEVLIDSQGVPQQ